MFRSIARWFVGASAMAVLVGTSVAVSLSVPYKERSAGHVTSFNGSQISFLGVGKATHIGKYTVEGTNDIDLLGNVSNGQVTLTTANGSTISGIYSGTYAPLATGQIQMTVHVDFQSATDQLEGITGGVEVVAIVDGVAPGSAFKLEGVGHLLFP